VQSENNFPTGAGVASSAAAFAALAVAAAAAAGLTLPERDLSRLARLGSGSASRSVPGGFVEWHAGTRDEDSFA
jgi:diphosphomevalonate decarboxylase